MRGASPSGCRLSRSTLTGGCSSAGVDAVEERRARARWARPASSAGRRDRRIGLVALEHQLDRAARRRQRRIVERPLGEHRRDSRPRPAGRCVRAAAPRASRPAAAPSRGGLRAAGLDEAQVPRRDLGLEREVELAQAAPLAPFAQLLAEEFQAAAVMPRR